MKVIDALVRAAYVLVGVIFVAFTLWGVTQQLREEMPRRPSWLEVGILLSVWGMFLTLGGILIRHGLRRMLKHPDDASSDWDDHSRRSRLAFGSTGLLTATAYLHAFLFPTSRIFGDGFYLWAIPSFVALLALPVAAYFLFPYRRRSLLHYIVLIAAVFYPVVHLCLLGFRMR